MKKIIAVLCLPAFMHGGANAQTGTAKVIPGAERIEVYLPLIKGKKLGIFANQTSMVGNTHLVDTLRSLGQDIRVIFSPEHGFRGKADAGEKVGNQVDEKTGIPIVSLYGDKRRPSAGEVKDVDILIFDIQDVGVRFYTYISSLQEFMEAAMEYHKPLMILDRPNPNGHYVDGPVLEKKFKSFVGMQPVPVVYGMTIGEYAFMIAGEKWLSEKANIQYAYYQTAENSVDTPFHFQLIKCKNYTHKTRYRLRVPPSPNLAEMSSVYWYPSHCFFEGTVLSEGRGTDHPFMIFGHPALPKSLEQFTPMPNEGAKNPKLNGQTCYGWNIANNADVAYNDINGQLQFKWLLMAYRFFPQKDSFFTPSKTGKEEDYWFNKLAGNAQLMQQIKNGATMKEIRTSWEPGLQRFMEIRKKYLMYED